MSKSPGLSPGPVGRTRLKRWLTFTIPYLMMSRRPGRLMPEGLAGRGTKSPGRARSVGFLIDTRVWIDVERGLLAPADVATLTSNEPVYLFSPSLNYGSELRLRRNRESASGASPRCIGFNANRSSSWMRSVATYPVVWRPKISAAGRQHRYRVQDLWLASQAIQYSYRFLTRNRREFEDIPRLDLVLFKLPRRTSPWDK